MRKLRSISIVCTALVALAVTGPPAPLARAADAAPEVVYGTDDRKEVKDLTGARAANAAATVALFRGDPRLAGRPVNFPPLRTLQQAFNLCAGQKFATQPVGAFCSGSLVGPDLILTAGHCIKTPTDLQQTLFIFGFQILSNGKARTSYPGSAIYAGKKIVKRVQTSTVDYALIQLDRRVTGRTPVKVSASLSLPVGRGIYVIGHPSGLPAKLADGAQITAINSSLLVANLDTFEGNSGSPVFNAGTNFQVGVLDRGQADYVKRGKCNVVNVLPATPGREQATRTTVFIDDIP
jgi:V8-like Glu-specific endopeptidase